MVADQAPAEFAGDIARRADLPAEQIEHIVTVFDPLRGGDRPAQDDLLIGEMGGGVKLKDASVAIDAPAGETGRGAVDILVDIKQRAAIAVFGRGVDKATVRPDGQRFDAKVILGAHRMEFEEFTSVVLVWVAA